MGNVIECNNCNRTWKKYDHLEVITRELFEAALEARQWVQEHAPAEVEARYGAALEQLMLRENVPQGDK